MVDEEFSIHILPLEVSILWRGEFFYEKN